MTARPEGLFPVDLLRFRLRGRPEAVASSTFDRAVDAHPPPRRLSEARDAVLLALALQAIRLAITSGRRAHALNYRG